MDSVLASGLVEVAIGLTFVYLVLSLTCSVVNEWIAGILGSRARNLEKGIRSLFNNGEIASGLSFAKALYNHGLIQSLYATNRGSTTPTTASAYDDMSGLHHNGPSYIPARTFGATMIDLLYNARRAAPQIMGDLHAALSKLPRTPETDHALTALETASDVTASQWVNVFLPADGDPPKSIDDLRMRVDQLQDGELKQVLSAVLNTNMQQVEDAVVDVLFPSDASGSQTVKDLQDAIAKLPPGKGREAIAAVLNQGQKDLEEVRASFEAWYNDAMDRVAGWYKRRNTFVLVGLGLAVAIATNTDSIQVALSLWNNPALRSATVAAADRYVKNYNPQQSALQNLQAAGNSGGAQKPQAPTTQSPASTNPATTGQTTANQPPANSPPAAGNAQQTANPQSGGSTQGSGAATGSQAAGSSSTGVAESTPISAGDVKKALDDLNSQLQGLQLPIGWASAPDPRAFPSEFPGYLYRILGWLFTAAALSLGAPFWFDVLNKFMVVRSTIKPQEKSKDEASKDA